MLWSEKKAKLNTHKKKTRWNHTNAPKMCAKSPVTLATTAITEKLEWSKRKGWVRNEMKKIFWPPWGWDNKVKKRQRAKKLEYAFQKQKSKRCITWKCSKNKCNSARDRKRRKKIRQIIYLYTSVMVLTRNILLVYSVHKVVIIIFFQFACQLRRTRDVDYLVLKIGNAFNAVWIKHFIYLNFWENFKAPRETDTFIGNLLLKCT